MRCVSVKELIFGVAACTVSYFAVSHLLGSSEESAEQEVPQTRNRLKNTRRDTPIAGDTFSRALAVYRQSHGLGIATNRVTLASSSATSSGTSAASSTTVPAAAATAAVSTQSSARDSFGREDVSALRDALRATPAYTATRVSSSGA